MRILFYLQTKPSHGLDTLYDGLCKVLGYENVVDYPLKPTLHGRGWDYYLHYPCFFNYPSPKNTLAELKEGLFDLILVGCKVEKDRLANNEVYETEGYELIKKSNIPKVLIDQGDRAELNGVVYNEKLCRELNPILYFKRECMEETDFVKPLPFSYAHLLNVKTERVKPVFFAGDCRGAVRRKYLAVAKRWLSDPEQKFSPGAYSQELLKTRIGLNFRGEGFDTVRYWEIPAHGAMLFSQKSPLIIPNNFVEGESGVFFESCEEFIEKMEYLIDNPDKVDIIRKNGYNQFRKYHTSEVRAGELLSAIRRNI